MSYFEYLKYNNYITYNEQIIFIEYNNNYSYKFTKPIYLIKLDIPDILIDYNLELYGEISSKITIITITKQIIELFKKSNFYFENLKSIRVYKIKNNDNILTQLPIINITFTFKNIKMKSSLVWYATNNDIRNNIESIHVLTNIIKGDTNLESIYIDEKANEAIYKFKLDKFKNNNTNLIMYIDSYLKEKYTLKISIYYIIHNYKITLLKYN